MKLSIETHVPFNKLGIHEGLRVIKDAGFDSVDMSYYWLPPECGLLGDDYIGFAKELKKYMDEICLSCTQAHAPFAFKYGEEMSMEEQNFRDTVRAIESAAVLGAKAIVVHSIGTILNDNPYFDRDYNIEFYKSLMPYAKAAGIKIAVENLFARDLKRGHYVGRLGMPEELCGFIKELKSDCFVACVDVGHAALTGLEPQEFISRMEPSLLKALHIQDGDYKDDRHTLPYQGWFNWLEIMKSLKNIGYDGEFTFEIFQYLNRVPVSLLPEALTLAEKTGRELISVFEKN